MTTKATELQARITADATAILASIEKTKSASLGLKSTMEATSAASTAGANQFASASTKAAKAVQGTANALSDLERRGTAAFADLANQGAQFASVLGPTGAVVGAAAIATVAIVSIFARAKQEMRELRESFDGELRSLERSGSAAGLAKLQQGFYSGDRLFGDPNSEAEKGNPRLRRLGEAVRDGGALEGTRKKVAEVTIELQNLQAASAKAFGDQDVIRAQTQRIAEKREELQGLVEVETELARRVKETGQARAVAEKREGAVQDFARRKVANEEAARDAERLATALESVQRRAEALNETLTGANAADKAANDIAQWAKDAEAAGLSAAAIALEVAKLQKGLDGFKARGSAEELKKFQDALEAQRGSLTGTLQKQRDLIDEGQREGVQRQQALTDLQEELAAREAGTEALDAYNKQKARTAAVEAELAVARAQAKKEGRETTDVEIAAAKQLGNQVADVNEKLKATNAIAEGGLLKTFGQLAEQATAIATSLGEGGRNLARAAAVLGPLFKGLDALNLGRQQRDEKTGKLVEKNGVVQTVSTISSLFGKNGAASQAQSIEGALSIVAVAATIADAVDLFGTRARERAKQMREAAEAFNLALDEFVIRDRTSLETSLRDNIAKADALRKQAGEANGFTFTGGPLKSLEDLRTQIAQLTQLGNSNAPVGVREQFLKLRDTLQELADKAEGNAAKLRELNAEELSRLSESLAVRRLAVQGLGDQADAERARLALIEEERELRAKFGDAAEAYITELRKVTAAEYAAAAATKARNEALSLLDDTLSILGGTKLQGLTTTIGTLSQLFPQLSGLFDGLDLSKADGLKAASERLRELFRTLSVDGISEAERPIVDAIKRLLGSIEGALGEITDPLASALEVFGVRVEVFGLDVKAQFGLLADIFRNAFPEIGALLDANAGGDLAALKASLQSRIAALLEGGISESERPLLAALQQLLGTVVGQIDDAARAAEEAAQKAEEARQRRVSESERRGAADASLRGLTGTEALQARLATLSTLSPALAGLLPLFSDTSATGIRASKDALFALFRQLEDGSVPITEFGDLTKDEIIERILELNGNLDDLAGSLSDAAKAAAEAAAAERQKTNDLRIRLAKARGEETRLAEFDLAAQRERETAIEAGRSAAFLAFLDQVLGSERNKLLSDIAGAATSAAISEASASAAEQSRNGGTVSRVLGGVTDVSVQVQNGYLRIIADNTRASAQYSGLLLTALGGMRAPSAIPIPSIPSYGGSSGGGVSMYFGANAIAVAAPIINTTNMVGAPADVGRQIGIAQGLAVQDALGRLLELDVRALGGRKR